MQKNHIKKLLAGLPMAKERRKVERKSAYGFFWLTLGLFLFSMVGHWFAAWPVFVSEQKALHQPAALNEYVLQMIRDTLENWQSEFLQLIWQVAGLTWLLHRGSPQSREGDDRKEEKLDLLIQKAYGDDAENIFRELEKAYPR